MTANTNRPTGVTIISILVILGGIAQVIGGLALITLGSIISLSSTEMVNNGSSSADMMKIDSLGVIPLVIGIVLLIIGIIYFVVSYGLLKGKGWAWTITIIVTIIGLITQVTSAIIYAALTNSIFIALVSHIIGIIINAIIIYYLQRPHVKAFFGK